MYFVQLGFSVVLLPALGVSDFVSLQGFPVDVILHPYLAVVYSKPIETKSGQTSGLVIKCAGSIISAKYILTAAHCILTPYNSFNPVTPDELTVYVDSSIPTRGQQQLYLVKSIFVHPLVDITPPPCCEDRACQDNDVAIIELIFSLHLGPGIQAIPLAKAHDTKLPAHTKADLSGYGVKHNEKNSYGPIYATYKVETTTESDCHKCHAKLEHVVCAEIVKNEPGTYMGGTGGSVVIDGVLEGISTCRMNMTTDCPQAFAPIGDYNIRAFIKEITGI